MKRTLLFFIMVLVSLSLFSQVPPGFNYQAIARDGSGNPIVNTTINVRLSVLSDTTGFYSSGSGTYVYEETHSNVKTNAFGMFTIVLGKGTFYQGSAADFSSIDWEAAELFVGTKIFYGTPASWKIMGSAKLWSVPYSMVTGKAGKADALSEGSKLSVISDNDSDPSALFEVRRKDGQTVFAVYPDAVNVYVPTGGKGVKGGFAIGGFGDKAPSQDYFRVTPDSVRVYIDNSPQKGVKGGFAIGGFESTKGNLSDFYMNVTGATTVNTVAGSPQVLWYPNKNAFLAGNVHIGAIDSVGNYSTALGYRSVAMGNYSQAFGYKAKSFGDYSTSIGKNSIAGVRSGGVSTASNAFAFGNASKATGNDSYAFGSGAEATGLRSFAFGSVGIDEVGGATSTPTKASGDYSIAFGMGAQAAQFGAMSLGANSSSTGYASTSLGFYSQASNYYSVAIGYYSKSTGYYAHSFGLAAEASGTGSLALGMYSKTAGSYAASMGYYSEAKNSYSVAIGYYAKAQANYSSAFGRSAVANGTSSMAIGYNAQTGASATDASALGKNSLASGPTSMALGVNASSAGNTSVALGYYAQSNGDYSFAIGTYGLKADGTVDNTRPTRTTDSYSAALGMGAQTTLKGDMAFGVNSTASGGYSTAIGYQPTASGSHSIALGYTAVSSGQYSTAMGYDASSEGNYSAAIGMYSQTQGSYATAMGYYSRAYGDKSTAIGSQYNYTYYRLICNKITGKCTFSPVTVNRYNTAEGNYSLAIGNGNYANNGGMSLGTYNTANSMGAVALGFSNTADSAYSFAAGYGNRAKGYNAFAFGENLTAQAVNSFVVGTYNNAIGNQTDWIETDPIFIIGNGESGNTHDAVRVNKNGGMYLYPENAVYGLYIANYNTSSSPYTYHYGIRSYIQRNKAGAYYYSGYFLDDGQANGTYNGLYADVRTGASIDVAEYINDTYGNTEPADVVIADPNSSESVIKSSGPYQTEVIGVISTNPHLTMGMEIVTDEKTGEEKKGVRAARLALTGRVPVNVTGENGPIRPGDYLTTSSTPGFAMKWTLLDVNSAKDFDDLKRILAENEKRRNAILGKAVESFSGTGPGKIMVLISLQ